MKFLNKINNFVFGKPDLSHPLSADFIRVVSAFSIAWYHIWQQSWVSGGKLDFWNRTGALWVDVMIMLSAFCLYLPWANAKLDGSLEIKLKREKTSTFYLKRAIRIIPGYYLSLAFSFVIKVISDGCSLKLIKDLIAHLTFTQMFFTFSYRNTELNGVTWTLTIFALFYVLFPLLRNLMLKHPIPLITTMVIIEFISTIWLLKNSNNSNFDMLFNQFPVFTGVIGIGMLGASLFAQLGRIKLIEKKYIRVLFSALGVFAFVLIAKLLKYQTKQEVFRISQLKLRLPISILAVCVIIFFGLGINLPLKKILAFLSKISFNLYLWHQMLTLWIKYTLRIPKWYGDTPPNIDGDSVWMHKFNLIAWTVSLIVALVVTYFIEEPIKRILENKLLKKTTK